MDSWLSDLRLQLIHSTLNSKAQVRLSCRSRGRNDKMMDTAPPKSGDESSLSIVYLQSLHTVWSSVLPKRNVYSDP
jgi:hypothetical protein